MGLLDAERIEDGNCIVGGIGLRVHFHVLRNIGWSIAAGRIGDAAVTTRKEAHLRFPGIVAAAELVDEQDRRSALSCRLIVKLCSILGGRVHLTASLLRIVDGYAGPRKGP